MPRGTFSRRPVSAAGPRRSKRFVERERRELRRELLITPYPELGLVAFEGPNDPEPGLRIEKGRVVFIDGRGEDEFDALDHFIARYGLDVDVAAEAAGLDDRQLAHRLVDVDVPRDELVPLPRGLTPAPPAPLIAPPHPGRMRFRPTKTRARPGAAHPGP